MSSPIANLSEFLGKLFDPRLVGILRSSPHPAPPPMAAAAAAIVDLLVEGMACNHAGEDVTLDNLRLAYARAAFTYIYGFDPIIDDPSPPDHPGGL